MDTLRDPKLTENTGHRDAWETSEIICWKSNTHALVLGVRLA